MSDYYTDCKYRDRSIEERLATKKDNGHKEDYPLYYKYSNDTADFSKVNSLEVGYD